MYDKSNDEADTSVNNCERKLTKWCRPRMINPLQVQMSAAPWSKMSSRRTFCHLERRLCHLVVSPAAARCAISRSEAVTIARYFARYSIFFGNLFRKYNIQHTYAEGMFQVP